MQTLERILVCGITGSGKSYQWLKMAEQLQHTDAIFRVIDSDYAIEYMLNEQFPHLKNVYVFGAFDWPEYKKALRWAHKKLTQQDIVELKNLNPRLLEAYNKPTKPDDWLIVEMADNSFSAVQKYFVDQTFQEEIGDYFLQVRKAVRARGDITEKGKKVKSIITEGLSGWVDWPVVNKLYEDYALPLFFRTPCHIYTTTRVEKLSMDEKDPEVLDLYGDIGIKPTGQKKIGHQHHTILLYVPGQDKWQITTIKDRGGRTYFKKVPFKSFYMQYLAAKAGWPMPE